jgi:hypothetical protein
MIPHARHSARSSARLAVWRGARVVSSRHFSPATCHVRPVAAFTLIEVLVSSAVLALMMAILLSSMGASLSLWRVTEGKISADREGRSGHFLLAQDLANAVVPTNNALWPTILNGGRGIGFLVLESADYQDAAVGDVGDVCYVEYQVVTTGGTNGLLRRFVGSKDTYAALKNNKLPTNAAAAFVSQFLADNVIPNTNALKGTPVINNGESAWIRNNFVAITLPKPGTNYYAVAGANRPEAIEVNLSTADRDAVLNTNLLALPNYQIRSAGFFTFRVNLPK